MRDVAVTLVAAPEDEGRDRWGLIVLLLDTAEGDEERGTSKDFGLS